MLRSPVLITGAGGFIGSELVNSLLARGHEVFAFDRDPDRLNRLSSCARSDLLRLVCADISDPTSMVKVARQTRPAVLIHLAAMHVIPQCEAQPNRAVDVNIGGLCNVLAAADEARVEFILFASTGDVYAPTTGPSGEDDPTCTATVYGATKLLGERLVSEWAERRAGRHATRVRIFNVYGPGDGNPHVLPDLLGELQRGGTITVGNVHAARDFIHVEDVVALLCRIVQMPTPPTLVNAGTGVTTSIADVLEMLEVLVGRPVTWTRDPSKLRASDRAHLRADTARMQALFPGFVPRSLDVGLGDLLARAGVCPL